MSAEKVIAVARGELGNTEFPPGSNLQKYGEAYGLNGVPWCLQFLWWCCREAGESAAFFAGAKTASCGTFLRWYTEQGQTVPVSAAQPGDVVILNFSGTTDTQHCGLIWNVRKHYLQTYEGNTSPGAEGSQDNGGCVADKVRYPSQIVGVCKMTYTKKKPKIDWEGHWAEEHIRYCIEHGYMQGYDDGTFRPNGPITRAELATIIHRMKEAI